MSHHVWLLWYNSNHAMPNCIDCFGKIILLLTGGWLSFNKIWPTERLQELKLETGVLALCLDIDSWQYLALLGDSSNH